MTETIIVFLIVGAVIALSIRSIYKTLTGRKTGCACSGKTCPSTCSQCHEMILDKNKNLHP